MRDGLLCTYVVARYRPAGNFLGEFAKNVLKGKFDGSECAMKIRKSVIEVGPQSEKSFDARIAKRSRIQRMNETTAFRKGQVEIDEEQMTDSPFHVTTNDDAVTEKVKSLWLPDLESGIHGSDLAGLIPLRVAAGTDIHLKKYANATMEDMEGSDSQLASNFAAKLIEQVKNARNINDLESKSKTNGGLTSKEDIDAASKGFQNMDESFKKSEPTLPPGSKVTAVGKYFKMNSNPKAIESGSARSGESPVAADISSKVNQAIQKLQSAAETVSKVAAQPNLSGGAPPVPAGVADSAMDGIQATTSNEAMAKFAANMIAAAPGGKAAANGPAKAGGGPADIAINGPEKPAVNPAAQGAQGGPSLNGQAPPGGPGGSLAAANMATANQQALSKAAEDKKAASAGYSPTGNPLNPCAKFLP